MFDNVVVGVGGHESWRDAIALAQRLLRSDGRLTLANIFVFGAEPHLSSGYSRDIETMERERAADLLRRARAQAGIRAGARWRGAASVGHGLHELAERLAADLLVVGTSRRGRLRRILSSDNTSAAMTGASCAVAVAPAGYARRACEIQRVRVLGERSARRFVPDDGSADLIVVASRGTGPLGRLVDRSTCRKLARIAQCPLLVLVPGASALAAAEALMHGESPVEAGLR